MRSLLIVSCVMAFAVTASAQDSTPRPFITADDLAVYAAAKEITGAGTAVGFNTTVGFGAWRGMQLFVQGGRTLDVIPVTLQRDQSEFSLLRQPGTALQASTWHAAAGVRWSFPSLWRLHPYTDASAGIARTTSHVEPLGYVASNFPNGVLRVNNLAPLSSVALGLQLRIGRHVTVDAGYRIQRFFGGVDTTRTRPFVGFGVRF